jgi:ATP-dependent RNA helicase HelY
VLADSDLSPGDFVRWTKQVIDLLDQVADAAAAESDSKVPATARAAVTAVRRGVVAYSSLG